MTRYICPDCDGDLVQMLERKPWDTAWDDSKMMHQNPSKHYGFYCKACLQMFREKMSLEKDKVREVEDDVDL